MGLKKLSDFIKEEIEPNKNGKRPDARTMRKLPYVFKSGGTWWVDMDMYRNETRARRRGHNRLNELMKDDQVAELVGRG